MESLIFAIYAGLFIFALNGMIMYGMYCRRIELLGIKEDVARMLVRIKLRGRR